MAEFTGGNSKSVNVDEHIVFENNTDSDFEVSAGIVFRKSGIYAVSIDEKRISVSKVSEINHDLPSAQPEPHYCRECKWSWCHINVDKHGKIETYWRCLNWDGETDEEGYCHEWERKTNG